jgi:ABC-type multidrug transport system permease subunit
MTTPQSTRRSRVGNQSQTLSDARSAALGAAFALILFAVVLGGLVLVVDTAWMRFALPACALVCAACGVGLFRASEWARVAGAITCFAVAIGAIVFSSAWTIAMALLLTGAYLALPSTKAAFAGIRARSAARR